MNNQAVAELLRSVAAAYKIKGEQKNRFRIIAYERAADAVEHLSSEIKDIWDEGKLDDIPGVGTSIAEHLGELFKSGKSKHFDKILSGLPKSMFTLMEVPGIGAKTAYRLSTEFEISHKDPVSSLEKIAKSGKIATLPGFGDTSQQEILTGIAEYRNRSGMKRMLLPHASLIAESVIEWLFKNKHVKKAEPLGSLRRKASTVGDVDIAVATDYPKVVIEHFTKFPKKTRVLEKGDHTATIIVPGDIHVDLMVQSPASFGSLLQHFTGSKHHNVALREYALKKKLSLSEYGIKPTTKTDKLKHKNQNFDNKVNMFLFDNEEKFYNFLDLAYIPPEIREGKEEIEAAQREAQGKANGLPKLIELKDVKGDLQIHSSFDIETSHDLGESSMEEIIEKGDSLGYEYIAFTEHNPSKSKHTSKQIVEILKRKREKIDKINYSLSKSSRNSVKKVFNSLEIDILPDGTLPVSPEGLETLDFALVSIHSAFRMEKEECTRRVLSALSNPRVKIFAHPTGRKINFREGVELDWPEIFEFCLKNDKWLEINGEPMRLDLPDFLVHDAVKAGVKLTFGTDSHHKDSLNNMQFAVSVARRGWATKSDIINTRNLSEFEKLLK